MKITLISFCFFMSSLSFAGGFRWPNVEYEYARLFLMNIPFNSPENMDNDVYANGIYAKTKIGDGIDLSTDFLNVMHGALAGGADELVNGLSGCYIPRHGIIYFDRLGKPVASFTLCLECEKISFWSDNALPEFHTDYDQYDIKKAEAQAKSIIDLFIAQKVPYFESPLAYEAYISSSKDYETLGEIFITNPDYDSSFKNPYSMKEVLTWEMKSSRPIKFTLSEENSTSENGKSTNYRVMHDDKKNKFKFSEGQLAQNFVEAEIHSNKIKLPNGVSIGMSVGEVQNSFGVYDGVAWPEHIQVTSSRYTIDYHFKRRTLVKIFIKRNEV